MRTRVSWFSMSIFIILYCTINIQWCHLNHTVITSFSNGIEDFSFVTGSSSSLYLLDCWAFDELDELAGVCDGLLDDGVAILKWFQYKNTLPEVNFKIFKIDYQQYNTRQLFKMWMYQARKMNKSKQTKENKINKQK